MVFLKQQREKNLFEELYLIYNILMNKILTTIKKIVKEIVKIVNFLWEKIYFPLLSGNLYGFSMEKP